MFYAENYCKTIMDINGEYVITGPVVGTDRTHTVRVPRSELAAYVSGELIQDALKSVSAEDREFLISGYDGERWKELFGEDEV